MHVGTVVPSPWDQAFPPLYRVGTYDLMFLTCEILQPRPYTLQACSVWCSQPVRSCSLILIPRRHVRSGVPNLWDPAAPNWYLVGMFDLVFRTREILQPRSSSSVCMFGLRSLPVRSCSSVCMCALISQPVKSCSSCACSLCCPNPWDPKTRYACSVLGPNPLVPAAPYTCLLWGPNPWDPV